MANPVQYAISSPSSETLSKNPSDRVNVGEGLIDDLAHGHLPNIFREMGGPAEFRHNRAGALRKVAIAMAVRGWRSTCFDGAGAQRLRWRRLLLRLDCGG